MATIWIVSPMHKPGADASDVLDWLTKGLQTVTINQDVISKQIDAVQKVVEQLAMKLGVPLDMPAPPPSPMPAVIPSKSRHTFTGHAFTGS